jgi:radical SAM superfamily enzyme YgiQ (UPF0313 family)
MRRSGCRQVLIGLESPEQSSLEGIELRTNFKAHRFATCKEAIRRIQEHGITVNGCFILGLDGHSPDIFEDVLEFAEDVALYDVQITALTPFPGTPLYDRLRREGRLLEPERWDLCTLFDVNYVPKCMTPDQLRQGIYWLAERLYSEECITATTAVLQSNGNEGQSRQTDRLADSPCVDSPGALCRSALGFHSLLASGLLHLIAESRHAGLAPRCLRNGQCRGRDG